MKATILIADDYPPDRDHVAGLVEEAGHKAICASNGRDAVRLAKEMHPDIILLDIMMPDLTGHEVHECLREEPGTAGIPIIMLTGLQDAEEKIRSLSLGAADFLSKPVNFHELMARITSLLRIGQLHEELCRRNRELEEANDFKTRMMMFASHDIKNCLTSIYGHAEFILLNEPPYETVLESVVDIRTAAHIMKELLGNFMDLSRLVGNTIELKKQPFDLQELIGESISLTQHSYREHRFLASVTGLLVHGDRARTLQVMNNLLTNAAKYSPPGSLVSIEVEKDFTPGTARISVRDEGPGIAPEYGERIFEPFFRIPDERYQGISGSGLGLSIARSLIELMDGKIGVHPNQAKGSCFWFTLPLRPEAAPAELQEWQLTAELKPGGLQDLGNAGASSFPRGRMGEGRRLIWNRIREKTARSKVAETLRRTADDVRRIVEPLCASSHWYLRVSPRAALQGTLLLTPEHAEAVKSKFLEYFARSDYLAEFTGPASSHLENESGTAA